MKSFSLREILILVMLVLTGMLIIAGFIYANFFLLSEIGAGGEFLLPWKASRAFLFEHTEPYSSTVASYVQEQVYGRFAHSGEEPYIQDLPFYLLLLYFPFGLLRDPVIAGAIWLFLCEIGLLTFTLMCVRLTDWQPRFTFLIYFVLFSALSFYSFLGLLENNSILLLSMFYVFILLALRAKKDELAGVLIALAFYQWEVSLLFLIFIFLRIFDEQRWRVLGGFSMITLLLAVLAFYIYPDWLWSFLSAVMVNLRIEYGFSPGAIFTRLWPDFGSRIGWVLTAILTIILIIEWTAARRAEHRRFFWATCLTLAITPLIGFRSEPANLVVLVLPLAFIFSVARERWRAGYWLVGFLMILIFIIPWILFFIPTSTLQVRMGIIFLSLPIFTIIGLYWIRWWALQPPRTWLDRAARTEYR